MTLPHDIARCQGRMHIGDVLHVCDRRDRCQRFVEPSAGIRQVWMIPVVVGYLCQDYIPVRPEDDDYRRP